MVAFGQKPWFLQRLGPSNVHFYLSPAKLPNFAIPAQAQIQPNLSIAALREGDLILESLWLSRQALEWMVEDPGREQKCSYRRIDMLYK